MERAAAVLHQSNCCECGPGKAGVPRHLCPRGRVGALQGPSEIGVEGLSNLRAAFGQHGVSHQRVAERERGRCNVRPAHDAERGGSVQTRCRRVGRQADGCPHHVGVERIADRCRASDREELVVEETTKSPDERDRRGRRHGRRPEIGEAQGPPAVSVLIEQVDGEQRDAARSFVNRPGQASLYPWRQSGGHHMGLDQST